MQLYPTKSASHLALTGLAMVGVGVAARVPAVVGWGGAILVAVALARAVTLVSVARIRAAGFEMLWSGPRRVRRAARGATLEIEAEVRNRDTLAARYVKLRAVHSPNLEVTIEPDAGEVPASGRLKVKVLVKTPRVGQHGLHGLALEVQGSPGMFEVPLTFANPFGVEVVPKPFATTLTTPRGGRSRLTAASGKPGRSRGEGSEVRELRDHHAGDPFRRIAWKASARRGKLLVREYEREERDVVWVLLEASVELWAGPKGRAPLDDAIDAAAAVVQRHVERGDRVGLAIFAGRTRTLIPPATGPAHAHKLAHALTLGCGTHDGDRSDLDELDVAVRVLEHLRPLDARGLSDVRRGDLDKLAARADAARAKAPFAGAAAPEGKSPRERTLRRYLAAYGIDSPPRAEPERRAALGELCRLLGNIARGKPRPSIVHVLASPPERSRRTELEDAIRRLSRGRALVVWSTPNFHAALEPPFPPPQVVTESPATPKPPSSEWKVRAPIAAGAVDVRMRVAEARGERMLRRLGVRLLRLRPVRPARPEDQDGGAGERPAAGGGEERP